MVTYLEEYKHLLQRGVRVYDELLLLYAPDKRAENDWADITLAETKTKRDGLSERLASSRKLSAAYTSTLIGSISHYLDSHWADYRELPVANPEKRQRVEQLHAELEAIAIATNAIDNALRAQ